MLNIYRPVVEVLDATSQRSYPSSQRRHILGSLWDELRSLHGRSGYRRRARVLVVMTVVQFQIHRLECWWRRWERWSRCFRNERCVCRFAGWYIGVQFPGSNVVAGGAGTCMNRRQKGDRYQWPRSYIILWNFLELHTSSTSKLENPISRSLKAFTL